MLQYKQEADTFFSYIENVSIPENNLFERVQLLNLKGIYQVKIGNRETGVSLVQQAIHILSALGASSLAKDMEDYMNLLLENTINSI